MRRHLRIGPPLCKNVKCKDALQHSIRKSADILEETLSDTPAEHSELANVDDDIKQPTTSGKSNLRAKENKQVSGSVSCAKMKHYWQSIIT